MEACKSCKIVKACQGNYTAHNGNLTQEQADSLGVECHPPCCNINQKAVDLLKEIGNHMSVPESMNEHWIQNTIENINSISAQKTEGTHDTAKNNARSAICSDPSGCRAVGYKNKCLAPNAICGFRKQQP